MSQPQIIKQRLLPERDAGALAYEMGVKLNDMVKHPDSPGQQFMVEVGGKSFCITVQPQPNPVKGVLNPDA